jgi:hypothetical protein
MPEVKLAVALMNKLGWDPVKNWDELPGFYPGRSLAHFLVPRVPVYTKVIGDRNFDDKLLIYREALYEYMKTYGNDDKYQYSAYVEFLCRPVQKGEYRGVLVVALFNVNLWPSHSDLTKVRVRHQLYDVELDRTSKQKVELTPPCQIGQALPPVPDLPLDPTAKELIGLFERFNETYPEETRELVVRMTREATPRDDPEAAQRFKQALVQAVDEERPPNTERTLGVSEAAAFMALSAGRVSQIHKSGYGPRDSGGNRFYSFGEDINGLPRFSEAECLQYLAFMASKKSDPSRAG